jgi:hypothetical protein
MDTWTDIVITAQHKANKWKQAYIYVTLNPLEVGLCIENESPTKTKLQSRKIIWV